jgi:hypothetical protein
MSKKRMTYALSQAAIDAVRKISYERSIASGTRVTASAVLEELIFKEADKWESLKQLPETDIDLSVSEESKDKRKERWGTASAKEGRAIVKHSDPSALFDTSDLDKLMGS